MLNQHQAVVQASKFILGSEFQEGVDIKTYITKEQRVAIIDMVVDMFQKNEADLSTEARVKFDTTQKLRTYTNGLVTNWFNKSKELNGGTKYEAKNPGSRAGSGDDQLKALKNLKTNLTLKGASSEALAKVEAAIEARVSAISASAPIKTKAVDVNVLPENLRDLV